MASTINSNLPATSTPLASAEMRANFAAAATDINALQISKLDLTGGTVSGNINATSLQVNGVNVLTANQNIVVTGDAAGSGTTAIALTLATTGVTGGTYTSVTVDAKGRVTAATNPGFLTANQTVTISGDISGAGTTAITATLPTVNANVGTFNTVTVNAKGLVTAASNGVASSGWTSGTSAAPGFANLTNAGDGIWSPAAGTVGVATAGKENTRFINAGGTPVNYLTLTNAATTVNPSFGAAGTDTNIGLALVTKGTGVLQINGVTLTDASNNIPIARLNSGTSASSSTFWRGDGTWATASGTGTVTSVGLAGTANELTVTGSTPITGSGSWTLSLPSALTFTGKTVTGGTFSGIALSGTTTTPAATDFTLTPGAAASVTSVGRDVNINGGPGGATSGTAGGVFVTGGTPTSGAGGQVAILGGVAAGTGTAGGLLTLRGGNGIVSTAAGGGTTITTGNSGGSGQAAGTLILNTGTAGSSTVGADIQITAGQAGTTGANGGALQLKAGQGGNTSGNGGAVTVSAGTVPTSGNGGAVSITATAGVGTTKNGGNVTITAGANTAGGTAGVINLVHSNVLQVNSVTLTDASNNIPVARLNSGTSAGATTYWRGDATWVRPPGSGSGTILNQAGAAQSFPPATLYGVMNTRNNHPILDFDAATEWASYWHFTLPDVYAGGGITLMIDWMGATATTGNVKWGGSIEAMTTDLDADSFATEQLVTDACNGTSGIVTRSSITFSSGANMDSLAANGLYRIKVARKAADAADTMAGNASILRVTVKET